MKQTLQSVSLKHIYIFLLCSIFTATSSLTLGFRVNPFVRPTESAVKVQKIVKKSQRKPDEYKFKDVTLKAIFYVDNSSRKALIKIKDKLHELSVGEEVSGIKVLQISPNSVKKPTISPHVRTINH